jgi:hypothetical protein
MFNAYNFLAMFFARLYHGAATLSVRMQALWFSLYGLEAYRSIFKGPS